MLCSEGCLGRRLLFLLRSERSAEASEIPRPSCCPAVLLACDFTAPQDFACEAKRAFAANAGVLGCEASKTLETGQGV